MRKSKHLRSKHISGQICLLLHYLQRKLWSFVDLVRNDFLHLDQLPLLQIRNDLGIWICACLLYDLELLAGCVLYRGRLQRLGFGSPDGGIQLTDATRRPPSPLEIHFDLNALPYPTFATFLSPIAASSSEMVRPATACCNASKTRAS